jgi:pyruvate-formate lyase-activating enzyme
MTEATVMPELVNDFNADEIVFIPLFIRDGETILVRVSLKPGAPVDGVHGILYLVASTDKSEALDLVATCPDIFDTDMIGTAEYTMEDARELAKEQEAQGLIIYNNTGQPPRFHYV